jgi:hypothetical protein
MYEEYRDEILARNEEPIFRSFGASSGRVDLRDINLGSISDSKSIFESLRE